MSKIFLICIITFFLCFAFGVFIYWEIKKLKEKKIFKELYKNNCQPACIKNSSNKIIWLNDSFNKQFKKIKIGNSFSNFQTSKISKQINIMYEDKNWNIQEMLLEDCKGILFSSINNVQTDVFLSLPFAVAIIDENNFLIEMNEIFKSLIKSSNYLNDSQSIQTILEQIKENEEAIWKTNEGLQPIKTSAKIISNKKILFLDNNIEMIKLKRKAQESQHLQILGQLTSSIIHDFKNLLTSIGFFAESLEEQLPNNTNLDQIKNNILQAKNLLKELLNFIKEKPVENEYVDPKKLLPKLCEMIKKLLGSKIKLKANIDAEGIIKISNTQLERILLNMVVNSKEAMLNGGTFTINTYKKEFTSNYDISEQQTINPGEYYIIEVKDTGTGIPKEYIKKIFTPFFSTKSKGTGLGLSSSLTLASHCGGGIKLDSCENGTTFYIILPTVTNLQNDAKNNDLVIQNGNENNLVSKKNNKIPKIILVEDEETIRLLIKKTLMDSYEISSFSEGISALEEIQSCDFDCLITDAVLPGMDGIELANTAYKKNSNAKIVLVSGYDFSTLEKNINPELKPQINYISKPFTLKKLKETIHSLLDFEEEKTTR